MAGPAFDRFVLSLERKAGGGVVETRVGTQTPCVRRMTGTARLLQGAVGGRLRRRDRGAERQQKHEERSHIISFLDGTIRRPWIAA